MRENIYRVAPFSIVILTASATLAHGQTIVEDMAALNKIVSRTQYDSNTLILVWLCIGTFLSVNYQRRISRLPND
jgi:hypothetical protein